MRVDSVSTARWNTGGGARAAYLTVSTGLFLLMGLTASGVPASVALRTGDLVLLHLPH